ncbi:MAG: HAD family hydrolase [bacterium]
MIKKVIFDIDDTLFNTSIDAKLAYEKFLENFDFDVTYEELYDKFEELNDVEDSSFEFFYNFLKDYLGDKLDLSVFKKFVSIYSSEVSLVSEHTHEVLSYLSSKYELITLSNWYYDLQYNKFLITDTKKYFKNLYTVDTFGKKPFVDTFKRACYPYDYSECVMIGDSLFSDIQVAKELGMKTIYLGLDKEQTCIKDIKELMDIL